MGDKRRNVPMLIGIVLGALWLLIGACDLPSQPRLVFTIGVLLGAIGLASVVARLPAELARPRSRKDQSLLTWSVAGEAAVIAFSALSLAHLRPDLILPLVALVVGAHFLPLARAFHKPVLRIVAACFIATAVVSLGLPTTSRQLEIGCCCGATLWLTVVYDAVVRSRRSRPATE